ncbi:MAG TPA: preprotein translocase subunit SecA [Gemmatimonadota bacterium]|nr:preprotein translocase subunit SecA [Gemmatimonadota bacterium]
MVLQSILKVFVGDKHARERKRLWPIVEEINAIAESMEDLSDEDFRAKTSEFRTRLTEGETLDDLLPEAYAVVKEACRRNLGRTWQVTDQDFTWDMVPFDVQLFGGIVLHEGKIAEMATGEGKTLVAVLPLYLNALDGRGVHLVTVNDYLARRDSEWVGEILRWLGLSVGVIQNSMSPDERRQAYGCDVTYGTNNEFGFDYLRDNMAVTLQSRVQRGHNFAIIDEVDSVLIDEARTPLIISGPTQHDSSSTFGDLRPMVERLVRDQTRVVNQLVAEAEALLESDSEAETYESGIKLFQARRGMPKHTKLMKLLNETGVKKLVQRVEADYMRDKRVHELDEALLFAMDEKGHDAHLTDAGREKIAPRDPELFVVPDLSQLMHQIDEDASLSEQEKNERRAALERQYAEKSETIHNISQLLKAYALFEKDVEYVVQDGKVLIVDTFTGRLMPGRRYSDGMHQAIEAKEGVTIEGETQTLATITIQNYYRLYDKLAGMTGTAETEEGEFYQIYKMEVVVIPTNEPVRRKDHDDVVYRTRREKYNAIIEEIEHEHGRGRPVLVGTASVEVSETLSRLLKRRNLPHNVLNAKHHQREAEIVARAGQPGAITIATNMAGRGTDIKLGPGIVPREWPEVQDDELPEGASRDDLDRVLAEDMPWGLHIVGTERHEARRIDRQLRGRAGRQGDPGSSRFFLSLEDDLMRLFSSDRIASVMDKLGAEEGEVITHSLVTRSIERAQKKVEINNFETRKRLLEYDDVMNKQREVIYELRLRALEGEREEVFDEARELVHEAAGTKVAQYVDPESYADDWDLNGLKDDLMRTFLMPFEWLDRLARDGDSGSGETNRGGSPPAEDLPRSYDAIDERIGADLDAAFERRIEEWQPERADQIVRHVVLRVIDEKWRDHLYELDQLKSGIQYRAWGQKDPLLEYKKEAFEMFVEMMEDLRASAAALLYRVQLVEPGQMSDAERRRRERLRRQQVALHDRASGIAPAANPIATGPGRDAASVPGEPTAPFIREGEKVGRNDPCPCGSGKKYKKCHGA